MPLSTNPLAADARLYQHADPDFASPALARGRFDLLLKNDPHPILQGVTAIEVVGTTADLALSDAAKAKAAELAATLLATIRRQIEATPEAQAEREAAEALAEAQAALAEVEDRHAEAVAAKAEALAAARDPRPFTATIAATASERHDVLAWLSVLAERHAAASSKVTALVNHAWRQKADERLSAMPARRAALRDRLTAAVESLAGELLAIAALESALAAGPAPT